MGNEIEDNDDAYFARRELHGKEYADKKRSDEKARKDPRDPKEVGRRLGYTQNEIERADAAYAKSAKEHELPYWKKK